MHSLFLLRHKWTKKQRGSSLYSMSGAELGIFIWGGQVAALIYLSKQPHTYTYTHAFLLYTHFLFDKLYIYIYTHQKKKKKLSIFNQNYVWWQFFIK